MRLALLTAALCAAALAGCGADEPPPRPSKPVKLAIAAPADASVVPAPRMEVRGSVSPPGAQVRVQGRSARVSGGTFSSVVELEPGPNVIDVAATARGRSTALTAFRVTREDRVAVPDLVGLPFDDAARAAERLDLRLASERGGGFLDPLLPRRVGICEQEPGAGERVRRGATVRVLVARAC